MSAYDKDGNRMTSSMKAAVFTLAGLTGAGCVGAVAAATMLSPIASAAPDCSGATVADTVRTVTGSAQQYLSGHPGAGQVLAAAAGQSPVAAEAAVRGYFTANPGEYYDLRGILAPIGDIGRQCNVTVLPPALNAAYDRFMAG